MAESVSIHRAPSSSQSNVPPHTPHPGTPTVSQVPEALPSHRDTPLRARLPVASLRSTTGSLPRILWGSHGAGRPTRRPRPITPTSPADRTPPPNQMHSVSRLQRKGRQMHDRSALQRGFVRTQPHARPIRRLFRIGKGIAPLHHRAHKLMHQMRMRAPVP